MAKNPHYQRWYHMLARCYTTHHPKYQYYGARGIEVCKEWHDLASFTTWIDQHLGPKPEGYTLDRIDNDGNYEPNNVRWASASTQNTNQRRPIKKVPSRRWERPRRE